MKKIYTSVRDNARAIAVVGIVFAAGTPVANAALTANSSLTQSITNGVLSTDIRNGSNVVVPTPSFPMSAVQVSNSQQTSTGTFGTASQRISVDNPGGADGGWTLSLNATTPGTGNWTSGSNNYAYNGTAAAGQLTVNPSVGTVTPVVGGATGVTLAGTPATFTGTTAITIATATAGSADIWNGYFTGIGLSQTIPASQPAGTYTLNMTQTVTAV